MKTPIYSTTKCHGIQVTTAKRKRRRIGTMPERLQNELDAMSTNERTLARIAVGMAMVTLLNQQ